MKKNFPGYFPPTNEGITQLWQNCIFTVDANILLNLYRYSDTTRNEFISALESIKERLWLSHQAALEYFENRLNVIAKQEKAYDETVNAIKKLQSDLSNVRQHPFITEDLMKKLTGLLDEVVGELKSSKAVHENRILNDEIQESIGNIFDEIVGSPYPDEKLEAIYKNGEDRYAIKLPPGYKDLGKSDDTSAGVRRYKKYGDLVIWQQIIDHASEMEKGIIFINDDKKEDWWLISRGKTVGPRPELIGEFFKKTGQHFYMYQADRFLEYAVEYLNQKITKESMDEIRDLQTRAIESLAKARRHYAELKHNESLSNRLGYYNKLVKQLNQQLEELKVAQTVSQEKFYRSQAQDTGSLHKLVELTSKEHDIREKLKRIERDLRVIFTLYHNKEIGEIKHDLENGLELKDLDKLIDEDE